MAFFPWLICTITRTTQPLLETSSMSSCLAGPADGCPRDLFRFLGMSLSIALGVWLLFSSFAPGYSRYQLVGLLLFGIPPFSFSGGGHFFFSTPSRAVFFCFLLLFGRTLFSLLS